MPRSILGDEQLDHSLLDHEDIDGHPAATPEDGDALIWNATEGRFDFVPVAGGHARGHNILDTLDHLDVQGTPTDGQVFTYNATAGKWEPQDIPPQVNVQDEGVGVTNTPHSTLNFKGTGVTASDAGGGVTDVTVPPAVDVQNGGSPLANNPHRTLDFVGEGVTSSDEGSGVAQVTIPITVKVQDDGTLVTGSPHSTLNFTGGVIVTNQDGEIVGIQIHAREHSIHGTDDHTDAPTVAPTDGQYLRWDDTTMKYVGITDQSGSAAQERPGAFFLGSIMNYPTQAAAGAAGEIQYTRVWLYKDTELDHMHVFVEDVPGSPSLRMGIYSQTDPEDEDGVPVTRVVQTDSYSLLAADEGDFLDVALQSSYTVPTTGYYWLALIVSATQPKFSGSVVYRSGFLPRYEESGTGTTLPATVGTITNPQAAVIFVAAEVA